MRSKCKSLCIKERQLRTRRRVKQPKRFSEPVAFRVDPTDSRQLILDNGCRLRQPVDGVGLYISQGGQVYSLTRFGLRPRRVDYQRKKNYCKPTSGGCRQGQCYPYVTFRNHTYRMHILMAMAWRGGLDDGFVPDHIDGNIDDFRYVNIRVVSKAENDWCSRILKRLRAASVERFDPSLDPINISQKDLLEIFKYCEGRKIDEALVEAIRRYGLVLVLRKASRDLHDPSLNPDTMSPERREEILSKYRVDPQIKINH